MKDNGSLTLTGGVYNVKSIKLKKKARLRFADSSEVRVIDKIEIGKETYVGPADGSFIDASDIIFYIAGDDKTAKIDEKTQFFGTVYAPDGKIEIKKKVEATGAFLAKEVKIDKEVELALSGYFGRTGTYPVNRLAWTEPVREVLPDVFALVQNFPNPFNPVTQIRYGLPEESAVKLIIYDILGREVRSWQWQWQDAGYHYVTWDGRNNIGQPISAGVYIYRIVAGDFIQTRKMVLLK